MPYIRQTNFSAGELSPYLWGRTDLEVFGRGCRTLRNFFVNRQGAAVSRPGTTYVAESRNDDACRLIPFIYSDSQSYVLEFGHEYVRFYANGGAVLSGGGEYEIATTYTLDEVWDLKWAQSGDTLYLTHPSHPPRTLTRSGHASWALADISTKRLDVIDDAYLKAPLPSTDATHPARTWSWVVTALFRKPDGQIIESQPFRLTQSSTAHYPKTGAASLPGDVVVYPDAPVTLWLPSDYISFPSGFGIANLAAGRVYRGKGDSFGWVGDFLIHPDGQFIDAGQAPDYGWPPPQGTNPFEIYDSAGTLVRTEEPIAVCFFEDRLVFAGTAERPDAVLTSKTGDYYNFDKRAPQLAGESLYFELAARRRENVRNVLPMRRLLVFTDTSVWSIGGVQGSPLDFDSVDAKVEVEIGASEVVPLLVDGVPIYVRTKGSGVLALVPRDYGYEAVDVSTQSQHLLTGGELADASPYGGPSRRIVEWCYQEDPWGIVWACLEDGTLLSLTFSPRDNTYAWTRHETDGEVVSICSVPETDEDAVYMVVKRQRENDPEVYYIERMTSRLQRGRIDDDVCVDCAAKYEGPVTTTLTGLDHLEGKDVWAVSIGNPPFGPLTVTSGQITLPETPKTTFTSGGSPILVMHVGLLFTPELETLDVAQAEARTRQKTVVSVGFEVDNSRGLAVGQDLEHLTEWRQHTVSSGYSPPSNATETVVMPVKGKWDGSSRAALRQTLPLPVTVVGITREVDIGG